MPAITKKHKSYSTITRLHRKPSQPQQIFFKPANRIYYLVTLPKPVETKKLFIQIFKVGGDKDERYGYDLVWAKHVKLKR